MSNGIRYRHSITASRHFRTPNRHSNSPNRHSGESRNDGEFHSTPRKSHRIQNPNYIARSIPIMLNKVTAFAAVIGAFAVIAIGAITVPPPPARSTL